MCIVFLAIRKHPDYPLIIAANRDEYHNRPSETMDFWADHPHVLSGRDLKEGGAWLGVTRSGRFCTVTNFAVGTKAREDSLSRGQLVRRFLVDEPAGEEFGRYLSARDRRYRPFNLIFGHDTDLCTYSNRERRLRPLEAGYHSISNGPMDHPWPKMSHGVKKLTALIDRGIELDTDTLTRLMQDRNPPAVDPDGNGGSAFSPIFIRGDAYGTRATTCLLFGQSEIRVTESCYDPSGEIVARHDFTIGTGHAG